MLNARVINSYFTMGTPARNETDHFQVIRSDGKFSSMQAFLSSITSVFEPMLCTSAPIAFTFRRVPGCEAPSCVSYSRCALSQNCCLMVFSVAVTWLHQAGCLLLASLSDLKSTHTSYLNLRQAFPMPGCACPPAPANHVTSGWGQTRSPKRAIIGPARRIDARI